jgi:hypothetical protein
MFTAGTMPAREVRRRWASKASKSGAPSAVNGSRTAELASISRPGRIRPT